MRMRPEDRAALELVDERLQVMLPEEYQSTYEAIQPTAMGSAGLQYDANGNVAWDEIWSTFCDLAMAGGPPHKGALLEPGRRAEIDAHRERYIQTANEICRGITLTTDLDADLSPVDGWVRVGCLTRGMSGWLTRAITMENVAVRGEGIALDLPAAPHFRLDKEIKNVITVIAKTCHYWIGHMPREQRQAVAALLETMEQESPLIAPSRQDDAADGLDAATAEVTERLQRTTGLPIAARRYAGWLGVDCPNVRAAIWMMRALVASNVLARREETALFVPINPATDPGGETVVTTVARIYGLATVRGVI